MFTDKGRGYRYQVAALELIKSSELEQETPSSQWTSHGAGDSGHSKKRFSVPLGPDLSKDRKYANQAASWGLEVLACTFSSILQLFFHLHS